MWIQIFGIYNILKQKYRKCEQKFTEFLQIFLIFKKILMLVHHLNHL